MAKIRNYIRLIEVYRAIEKYIKNSGGDPPAMMDLVNMGLAASGSVISYYYESMASLGMVTYTTGRARSVHLLPLQQADPTIYRISQHEYKPVTAGEFVSKYPTRIALIGQFEWEYKSHDPLTKQICFKCIGGWKNCYLLPKKIVYLKIT